VGEDQRRVALDVLGQLQDDWRLPESPSGAAAEILTRTKAAADASISGCLDSGELD